MSFVYAGFFPPQAIISQTGIPEGTIPVTVYEEDGETLATLYTDATMDSTVSNPIDTDTFGNLSFYTNPQQIVLSFEIANETVTIDSVVWPWYLEQSASTPTGLLATYASTSVPTGWQACDGSELSRTDDANLFAVIGTAFGDGDGSTTFNVPDFRSRSPIGVGQGGGLSNYTLAQQTGEENHVLSTGELASHNHGVTDPGHDHLTYLGPPQNSDYQLLYTSPVSEETTIQTNLGGDLNFSYGLISGQPTINPNTTGITIGSTGSSTGHNTIHPVLAVQFMIKL